MTNINHCLFLTTHGVVLPVGGKLCTTAQLFPLTLSLTILLIFQLPLPFLLLPNPLSLFSAKACYLNFMPLFLLSHQQLSLSMKLGWILLSLINKFSFLVIHHLFREKPSWWWHPVIVPFLELDGSLSIFNLPNNLAILWC